MRKRERGSLTVEAVLFLIPFMCAFLTLINMARYVQAEMLIHHAITQTAKQMSTYSYVLTKTKVTEKMQSTNKKSTAFKGAVTDVYTAVTDFIDVFDGDDSGSVGTAIGSAQTAYSSAKSYITNPKEILTGALAVCKSTARGVVMTNVTGAITRGNIKEALSTVTDDPNEFLKRVGVVDGLDGLDFSESEWITNSEGKGNLDIVVTYTMENVLFPDFDFGQYEFCQSVSTLSW